MMSYITPPIDLLPIGDEATKIQRQTQLEYFRLILEAFIQSYKLKAVIQNESYNDISVIFTLALLENEKSDKIMNLRDDLEFQFASPIDIRAEGNCVVLAIMRYNRPIVSLRSVMESHEYKNTQRRIPLAIGIDAMSDYFLQDLGEIDNLLIAGTTGSGKSTFLNDIILSIMYNADPSKLRLILMDTKVVDLSPYNGIPHLMRPNITSPELSFAALEWAVSEAAARLSAFTKGGYANIDEYNKRHKNKLAEIVIIYDEFVRQLQVSRNSSEFEFKHEVLRNLTRYTKKTGIHLILTAQHVPADVVTPMIKENIAHRISFFTPERGYSRLAIGRDGAERLFGLGDMIYVNMSSNHYVRAQAAYCSYKDVDSVIDFVKAANRSLTIDKNSGFLVKPEFI